ncbi:hypothetical protein PQC46_gp089 [Escherichia phage O18-011]|uniref:Uncharacterized protein n=1 Tax=Escherichia phage O18-011 TaxID=2742113 RepID=A0A6J4EJ77_9CAUD|nr:hypothetical protein PQC46_gp089 [Escherichia phage O18-011]BCG45146.1 hypothetical protein [Escherichia phage O18-011]
MTEEEFQELKGLTTEVQLKAMTFGRACHRFDTCDESSKEACKSYMDKKHLEWGKASNDLYNYMKGLVK